MTGLKSFVEYMGKEIQNNDNVLKVTVASLSGAIEAKLIELMKNDNVLANASQSITDSPVRDRDF